ncbi:MAG: ACT domain-containing protein [Methanocellales archaeon]
MAVKEKFRYRDKIIKQISLFAENKPGRLANVTEHLYKANINIRAFTIAEAGDFGVIRMVVDDPKRAYKVLRDAGFTVSETDVIGIEMADRPGGLYEIAKQMGDNNINIEYAYAFVTKSSEKAMLIVRVTNTKEAIKVLRKLGLRLVGSREVQTI